MSLSSAAFLAENFAGTVSVLAGAPGTLRAPLTNTALGSAVLPLLECEPGSSLPPCPDGVCWALCPAEFCGSLGTDCGAWALARLAAARNAMLRAADCKSLLRMAWLLGVSVRELTPR